MTDSVVVLSSGASEVPVVERVCDVVVVAAPARIVVTTPRADLAVMTETERIVISTPGSPGRKGLQGDPGPRGATGGVIEMAFHFGDASPELIGTFTGTVIAVSLVIIEPFDGLGAQLQVTAGAQILMSADENLPAESARYETNPAITLATATPITLSITPGAGATIGAGIVYLEIANEYLD